MSYSCVQAVLSQQQLHVLLSNKQNKVQLSLITLCYCYATLQFLFVVVCY